MAHVFDRAKIFISPSPDTAGNKQAASTTTDLRVQRAIPRIGDDKIRAKHCSVSTTKPGRSLDDPSGSILPRQRTDYGSTQETISSNHDCGCVEWPLVPGKALAVWYVQDAAVLCFRGEIFPMPKLVTQCGTDRPAVSTTRRPSQDALSSK